MDATLDVLPGEGEEKVVKKRRIRVCCENCGEPAHFMHTYLLDGTRRNPASSAYGKDDCSWCSDLDAFACKTCEKPRPDGYVWCSTFSAVERFAHMFLKWKEEVIS